MGTVVAPNGTKVRIIQNCVVFCDLSPAMGRCPAFAQRALENNDMLEIRRLVHDGSRDLHALDREGLLILTKILKRNRSNTIENAEELDNFIEWAETKLVLMLK